jgi:ribose transport system ATP-binding protein
VTTLLSARGVRKSFGGVEVLHGVDLDAAAGSILALLGENGAGKSTLVKILAGDYQPDEAEIEIGGRRYDHMTPISARSAGVRMIYQEFQDAPPLTVAENISARPPAGAPGARRLACDARAGDPRPRPDGRRARPESRRRLARRG